MAIIVTVFLIVPTLAPVLGQTLLQLGSWRYTFAVGPVFGLIVALWSTKAHRVASSRAIAAPIDVRSLARTVGEILRTRRTLGNALALMFISAAFLPYLGSSERMYGEIYGRGDTFFLWFAISSVVMAGFTLLSARVVRRIGARRTTAGAFVLLLVVAVANVAITIGIGWRSSICALCCRDDPGDLVADRTDTVADIERPRRSRSGCRNGRLDDRGHQSPGRCDAVAARRWRDRSHGDAACRRLPLVFSVTAAVAATWANRRSSLTTAT